jgi:hypothetical protein
MPDTPRPLSVTYVSLPLALTFAWHTPTVWAAGAEWVAGHTLLCEFA